MNKETITLDWALLGARLARLTTDEQIPFFKIFAQEMLRYESNYAMGMQLAHIREGMSDGEGLSDKEKEVYGNLGYVAEKK